MKAIRNMKNLPERLKNENPDWQRVVYEETGTIPVISDKYAVLFSNCGYIDLDNDAEYSCRNGADCTEYCDVNSIRDLVSYIKSMESYSKYLVDRSFGQFTKSDLFWSVFDRILLFHENLKRSDGSIRQDWNLSMIYEDGGEIVLDMALIDYDSVEMSLNIETDTSLDDTLTALTEEINQMNRTIDGLPEYGIAHAGGHVPLTYEELHKDMGRVFL